MSAFLGPIHVKMYGRVLYQDAVSQAILDLAEESGWASGLQEKVDSQAPAASTAPLEQIIDQSNIHGWLNEAVANCERRFALIVCNALKGHPERLAELQSFMEDLGRQCELPAFDNAEQAFQVIHDMLLDGMPCDFPFEVSESHSEEVKWLIKSCPHTQYIYALKAFLNFTAQKSFSFQTVTILVGVFTPASARHDLLVIKLESVGEGLTVDGILHIAVCHKDNLYKNTVFCFGT